MAIKLVKLKLNDKKLWLDWCKELKKRKSEVFETLKNEGVQLEACFLSQDEKHVYYLMEAEDFEKAKKVVEKSVLAIDKEHTAIRKKSLEKVAELKELFYFKS